MAVAGITEDAKIRNSQTRSHVEGHEECGLDAEGSNVTMLATVYLMRATAATS